MPRGEKGPDWREYVWREWRRTPSREHAAHLFELVAEEPAGPAVARQHTLRGVIGGIAASLVPSQIVWLLAMGGGWAGEGPPERLLPALALTPLLMLAGALFGAVSGRVLWRQGAARWTWREYVSDLLDPVGGSDRDRLAAWRRWARQPETAQPPKWTRLHKHLAWRWLAWSTALAVPLLTTPYGSLLALSVPAAALAIACLAPRGEAEPHMYRRAAAWANGKASLSEVEWAIRTACRERPDRAGVWPACLARLDQIRSGVVPGDEILSDFGRPEWERRWAAWHYLATAGLSTIRLVLAYAEKDPSLRAHAEGMVRLVCEDTRKVVGSRASQLICGKCFVHCGKHRIDVPGGSAYDYYGCRSCGMSHHLIPKPKSLTLVLDESLGPDPVWRGSELRVNWLARARAAKYEGTELYDFDRVEIVSATETDVDHFLVDVANDTDADRRKRYAQIPCLVAADSGLSDVAIRKLRDVFPGLRIGARRPRSARPMESDARGKLAGDLAAHAPVLEPELDPGDALGIPVGQGQEGRAAGRADGAETGVALDTVDS